MEGGTISGNSAERAGGGVACGGTFTMSGGEISNNQAKIISITTSSEEAGGGVYTAKTFIMTGGKISGNTANKDGGGVYIAEGKFTMEGGEISGNTANQDGGGVYNANTGTFSMENGKISNNTAARDGGGVCNYHNFTMKNSKILSNTCTNTNGSAGGGVFNFAANFTMEDSEICSNKIGNTTSFYHFGSGISNSSSGSTTISGGKISDNTNTAGQDSYGIYNISNCKLIIKNNPEIKDTIYLYNGATGTNDTFMNLASAQQTNPLKVQVSNPQANRIIAKPNTGYTLTDDDLAKFQYATNDWSMKFSDANKSSIVLYQPTFTLGEPTGKLVEGIAAGAFTDVGTLTIPMTVTGSNVISPATAAWDGTPDGLTISDNGAISINNNSGTITITTDGTAVKGDYPLNVNLSSASGTETQTKTIKVLPKPTLTLSPASLNLREGETTPQTITATIANTADLPLTLEQPTIKDTTGSAISGVTPTVGTPQTNADGTITIPITVPPIASGNYTLTTSIANVKDSEATATITVTAQPIPTIALSPKELNFTQGDTTSQEISVTTTNTSDTPTVQCNTNDITCTLSDDGKTITVTPSANVAAGTYTLTASVAGIFDTATITVNPKGVTPAPTIALSPKTLNFTQGDTTSKEITVTTTNTTDIPTVTRDAADITCTLSDDGKTITVTPSANVAAGTYTLTASVAGVSDTATITVNPKEVIPAPTIALSPKTLNFTQGDTTSQEITVTTTNTTDTPTVQCNSSDIACTLSDDGKTITVTPSANVAAGTYTLTASVAGISDTATITITTKTPEPTPEVTLKLSPTSHTFTEGKSGRGTMVAIVTPKNTPISLKQDTLPNGLTTTLDNDTITITFDGSEIAGTYTFQVIAGNQSRTATILIQKANNSSGSGRPSAIGDPSAATIIKQPHTATTDTDSSSSKLRFLDVPNSAWFADAVDYVADNQLMNGTGYRIFSPSSNTTRGMIITILHRMEKEPQAAGHLFDDVSPTAYYANAVSWGHTNNIIYGYTEQRYAPEQEISREQLAAILYRYMNYKKYDTSAGKNVSLSSFSDAATTSAYAVPALQWAVGADLIEGNPDHTLNPTGKATRAQVATMLMRFCEKVAK